LIIFKSSFRRVSVFSPPVIMRGTVSSTLHLVIAALNGANFNSLFDIVRIASPQPTLVMHSAQISGFNGMFAPFD